MAKNYALVDAELEAGFVLTCQSPPSDRLDRDRLRRMTETRHSREDVIAAAGRLFAERGTTALRCGTSDASSGLLGSSLYSHIGSKEELLIEVAQRGEQLFQESAEQALSGGGTGADKLRALIAGHLAVMLDHRQEVGTFLNEAHTLDTADRRRHHRVAQPIRAGFPHGPRGRSSGSFAAWPDTNPPLVAIFLLSILNATERWYSPHGTLDRHQLADEIYRFVA